jgi:hypothetical protein
VIAVAFVLVDLGAGCATPAKKALLDKVKLRDSDLPPSARLKVFPGNDQVWRQVTLDFCGADYPSESARVARLQQTAVDADGKPLGARGGFSKVAGVPPLKYDMVPISANQLGDLTPDHVVLSWIASDQSGDTQNYVAVFQRRGRVMIGLYGVDLASIKPLIPIVAARLAALSVMEAGE